jgi:hypothetical protein
METVRPYLAIFVTAFNDIKNTAVYFCLGMFCDAYLNHHVNNTVIACIGSLDGR